jgi:acetyl esterase/lipase
MSDCPIPAGISAEAREVYLQEPPPLGEFDVRVPAQAAELRALLDPQFAETINAVEHPYQLDEDKLGGVPGLWASTPATTTDDVALLYLHGGGYVLGTPTTGAALTVSIAHQSGMKVFSPDYRLAPEHPFPAALDDAVAAYRGLLDAGHAPDRIGVTGDSAGGGLALALVVTLRDADMPMPGALGLISPWTDLTGRGDSVVTLAGCDPVFAEPEPLFTFADAYAGDTPLDDPRISPLNANLTGLPPMLIQAGSREILLSDSTRLAHQAQRAGVDVTLEVWDGMWHVFHMFANVPEAQRANAALGAFFRRRLG